MKIGIIGNADRAVAWEKNLRPHPSVEEVTIARELTGIGPVDACILIDDSPQKLPLLLESIKQGYHSFLVSRLPQELDEVKKIYYASQESNVTVQFSHWPTLAPDSQWMLQQLPKPRFIQIVRQISHASFLERDAQMKNYWLDELALCIKWIGGSTHHVDVNRTLQDNDGSGALHLFLRFDSGATAGILLDSVSDGDHHERIVSDRSYLLHANIEEHTVEIAEKKDSGHFYHQKRIFDPSKSAEIAALQFLKAIQMRRPSSFGAYDLMKTLKVARSIQKQLTF